MQVPLHTVCVQSRDQIRSGDRPELKYVGLESIESGTGEFVDGDLSKTPEVPRAASFHFDARHVLYGKLRPYLNKVAIPEFEGKCSTELVPLLPSKDLDRRYLAYFLRSPATVQSVTARTAGSRMPRADMRFLLRLEVSLPPLTEQRRIVDLLSRAEGIVRLRREARRKAAELIPAIFLDLIGDPAANPKRWPMARIDSLCSVQTGATPHRKEARYFDGGTIPWIKTTLVNGDPIVAAEDYITESAVAETNCKIFPAGTVLVAMYGQGQTRGRVGILEIDAATNQACAAILPGDKISRGFLFHVLRIQYERLRAMGRGGNQANLNLNMIKELEVPLPPGDLQCQFAAKAEAVRGIIVRQTAALATAQATFDALLHRAFKVAAA